MAKRLILKHALLHCITSILETLRSARIKAPAGGKPTTGDLPTLRLSAKDRP